MCDWEGCTTGTIGLPNPNRRSVVRTSGFLHPYIYRYTARVPRDRFLVLEGEGITWMGQPSCQVIALFSVRIECWRSTPQKRQVGSAFALTYILLLRSCKLMGVFIIHPCLPSCWSSCTTAGPLHSTGITPLHCYCWPLRLPLAVHCLPGVTGYTVFCSVVFLHGTRRASPVA